MSILHVNRSKAKYCALHNGMITWNYLPDIFKVNIEHGKKFLSKITLRNIDTERHHDYICFDMRHPHAYNQDCC